MKNVRFKIPATPVVTALASFLDRWEQLPLFLRSDLVTALGRRANAAADRGESVVALDASLSANASRSMGAVARALDGLGGSLGAGESLTDLVDALCDPLGLTRFRSPTTTVTVQVEESGSGDAPLLGPAVAEYLKVLDRAEGLLATGDPPALRAVGEEIRVCRERLRALIEKGKRDA